ncbi:ubiquitin carboxyl-terminal hydrolase family protein [Actinidia rufa]|uniref:Ubiquitin carboxyl-terminal hydrolase family protein n=1 Tax=Actinidia rufa TaxID=165716 RepID=A0A7J0G4P1_9ERIC|nr:ubiquitin carboxyl-terminal hydrolase family protein [Actinidia rufa]
MFLRPRQCLVFSLLDRRVICEVFSIIPFGKSGYMRVPAMHKTCGGGIPKKNIYYGLRNSKAILFCSGTLKRKLGFVQKWNFMAAIEKYTTIFRVSGGTGAPPMVMLTKKAEKIAAEEVNTREQMEPILVKNLRKLLMLSVDCRLPLETIKFIESAMVTSREERFAREGILNSVGSSKEVRISKDGNYAGHFVFRLSFPAGFRPIKSYLEEVQRWQKMEFPPPYLNAMRLEISEPRARKRVVAVLHELLNLTMVKRMASAQLDVFHSEYRLSDRSLLFLLKILCVL